MWLAEDNVGSGFSRTEGQLKLAPTKLGPVALVESTHMQIRKHIRLPQEAYLGCGWFFVTICTHRRLSWFKDPVVSSWLVDRLKETAASQQFLLHAWCVMPDHLHILVQGANDASNLPDFVRRFKQRTAHEARKRFGLCLWQRYFFDHVLRPKESPDPIAWYILMNPVRKGLCARPEEYPFSGSLTFDWKGTPRTEGSWVPPWKSPHRECG
jgi:REP element-mobilizing transposase RayT